jgi:hypothetical protein
MSFISTTSEWQGSYLNHRQPNQKDHTLGREAITIASASPRGVDAPHTTKPALPADVIAMTSLPAP